jgi:hypothetical protein
MCNSLWGSDIQRDLKREQHRHQQVAGAACRGFQQEGVVVREERDVWTDLCVLLPYVRMTHGSS